MRIVALRRKTTGLPKLVGHEDEVVGSGEIVVGFGEIVVGSGEIVVVSGGSEVAIEVVSKGETEVVFVEMAAASEVAEVVKEAATEAAVTEEATEEVSHFCDPSFSVASDMYTSQGFRGRSHNRDWRGEGESHGRGGRGRGRGDSGGKVLVFRKVLR